jgi:hypothetical protein
MKGVSECAVLTIALAALAQPVLARTYLNCSTRKVVLISAPSGDTSSAREEDLGFWVDDETKTLTFLDNTPLTVTRLDRFWVSADRDGIFYEFDRRDGTLTYASSTTKDGVSTTIVGSGRCEAPPCPFRKFYPAWESRREAESSHDLGRCLQSCTCSGPLSTCSSRAAGWKPRPVSSSSTQHRLEACAAASSTTRQ